MHDAHLLAVTQPGQAVPMANRSRREEMRLLLARRDRRSLTYRELSEECGIPAHTLSWWAWKLRSEAPAEPSFVELEVHAEEWASCNAYDEGVSPAA